MEHVNVGHFDVKHVTDRPLGIGAVTRLHKTERLVIMAVVVVGGLPLGILSLGTAHLSTSLLGDGRGARHHWRRCAE